MKRLILCMLIGFLLPDLAEACPGCSRSLVRQRVVTRSVVEAPAFVQSFAVAPFAVQPAFVPQFIIPEIVVVPRLVQPLVVESLGVSVLRSTGCYQRSSFLGLRRRSGLLGLRSSSRTVTRSRLVVR